MSDHPRRFRPDGVIEHWALSAPKQEHVVNRMRCGPQLETTDMTKLNLRKPRNHTPAATAAEPAAAPAELMTIRDAMAFAKVSDATVRRWIRLKLLPSYKAGVQVRVDKRDLVKFLQS